MAFDLNRDGTADLWKLFTRGRGGGEVLTCKKIDLNFDGARDTWIHYSGDGDREVEEMDLEFYVQIEVLMH